MAARGPPRPPRGFRDYPPEAMIRRLRALEVLRGVFEAYGFDPLDTPSLEYWETVSGKYGEEAETKLVWRFKDPWSGREYALRYDLTVPLARFIASNRGLQLPFKRYHIGSVWRHEEPQRGRYREFVQCDADIVGSPYPEADAEVMELTIEALNRLGLGGRLRLRVNDRRLLAGIFEEELGIREPAPVYRAIDKLDKVGVEGVKRELYGMGMDESVVERIVGIITEEYGDPLEALDSIALKYRNRMVEESYRHLREALELVGGLEAVRLDLSMVRGLDYYTGPIFEASVEGAGVGSVAGGGRYDGLIGMFLGEKVPATGVSIGLDRLVEALKALEGGGQGVRTVTQAQVIVVDRESYRYAWSVARLLRREGFKVRIDLSRASEKAQRRKASKLGVPVLIFIGAKERSGGSATIYSTATGHRETVELGELPSKLLSTLRGEAG